MTMTLSRREMVKSSVALLAGASAAPDRVRPSTTTVNVRSFGAKGDGVTDDTHAIQASINAVQARAYGGTIYLPAGSYLISSGRRTSLTTEKAARDGSALVIAGNGVKLQGAGIGKTRIIHVGLGGVDAASNWQIVDGAVWRGHGIMIASESFGTTFADFELSGGAPMTGNDAFPANPVTGDGWDLTHKGVYLEADGRFDRTQFERVHFHHYRGEIVYGGGADLGHVQCLDSEMHDTNGDCWSVQAACDIRRNHFYNAAANCIDGVQGGFHGQPSVIMSNRLSNAGVGGIYSTIIAAYGPLGELLISNNIIRNARVSGIPLTSPQETTVIDNILIDCGWKSHDSSAIQVSTSPAWPIRNLKLMRNVIAYCSKKPSAVPILIVDDKRAGMESITVSENVTEKNKAVVTVICGG